MSDKKQITVKLTAGQANALLSDKKQITVKLTAGQANALLYGMSEAFQEPESLYMCKYGEREHGKALRAVNKIKEALKNAGLYYLDI